MSTAGGGDPAAGETKELSRQLANELRRIGDALGHNALDPAGVAAALPLARELRAKLEGPSRPRWYDDSVAASPSPGFPDAFRDQSPVQGTLNPVAPPLALGVETRDGAPVVVATGRLGRAYEGPPHGVHGGIVAALFDEVLGATQGLSGMAGVTAILKVRYREITPLDAELRLEGWVEKRRGRYLFTRASCRAGDTVTAEAEAIFAQVDFREVESRMRDQRRR